MCRFAALLVAVALSGVLQPSAVRADGARAAACRCGAHAGGAGCGCPRHPGRAGEPRAVKGPPCHPRTPGHTAADERRGDEGGASCVKASCGFPELPQASTTPARGESFTIPELRPLARPSRSEVLRERVARLPSRVTAPETPPPRRA